ncbi:hypothetical protein A9Q84_00530 [Halobacteriovorax marinus]|uniref:Fatty acid desaturase domain-containing protein n=1 Tax=Halobacteriovorax marinus TaxID=97084 RepID=A0A1Y5FBP6_9BACT|nr:hypothetical protein A9Q84_00530 [Halobacteriovorax marinus]
MNFYKKDPNYFLNYFKGNLVLFSILSGLLLILRKDFFYFEFHLYQIAIVLSGIVFGLIIATTFHNTSHGNIKPRWLNTVIGEFCGAYTLDGMRNFRVGHMLHHIHTDDPELDPHPPLGLSFIQFIITSKDKTIEVLINAYFKFHGKSQESEANIKSQILIYKLGVVSKILFWFLLFGPVGFLIFYIPSYLSYFLGFAHLNYISHQPDESGDVVVKNHDGTVFYKIMNALTAGGYYHKNHHLFPGLYNPSKAFAKRELRKEQRKVKASIGAIEI